MTNSFLSIPIPGQSLLVVPVTNVSVTAMPAICSVCGDQLRIRGTCVYCGKEFCRPTQSWKTQQCGFVMVVNTLEVCANCFNIDELAKGVSEVTNLRMEQERAHREMYEVALRHVLHVTRKVKP